VRRDTERPIINTSLPLAPSRGAAISGTRELDRKSTPARQMFAIISDAITAANEAMNSQPSATGPDLPAGARSFPPQPIMAHPPALIWCSCMHLIAWSQAHLVDYQITPHSQRLWSAFVFLWSLVTRCPLHRTHHVHLDRCPEDIQECSAGWLQVRCRERPELRIRRRLQRRRSRWAGSWAGGQLGGRHRCCRDRPRWCRHPAWRCRPPSRQRRN
jgi:hypothetical protein